MPFLYHSPIRFVDTDASQRIHFTAMLRHFEAAEQDFLRSIGRVYTDMQATGIGYPRVHVECTYTGAVRFDDPLTVAVTVERIGTTSYTLAFAGTVEERAVAHGRITIVALDLASQRARPLPEQLAEKLRGYQTLTGN